MKTVKVATIPNCDLCGMVAKYDAPTLQGPWAYMCPQCYTKQGSPTTGSIFEQLPPPAKNPLDFDKWLEELDAVCMGLVGLSYLDLGDWPSRDTYDSGINPAKGCQEMLDYLREDDVILNGLLDTLNV